MRDNVSGSTPDAVAASISLHERSVASRCAEGRRATPSSVALAAGREPRIIDYIVIAVLAPLLVVGILTIISDATESYGKSSENHSRTTPLESTEGNRSQEKDLARFEPVYLDDLPEENGSKFILGPVSIGGHTYQHGIQFGVSWIYTKWEANYTIPQGAHTFSAIIGNDDEQEPESSWETMSLLYEVLADGRLVGSGHAKGYSHDGPIHADVSGKARLTLRVTVVSGLNSTTADWAEPVFR